MDKGFVAFEKVEGSDGGGGQFGHGVGLGKELGETVEGEVSVLDGEDAG